LPQVPGGTYADRFIIGVAVVLIAVMDRIAAKRSA
jgi:hypothetical protein